MAAVALNNPWKSFVMPNNLYDENESCILEIDKDEVDRFNDNINDSNACFVKQNPPMPFLGNPLTAKVIFLSLNPGYIERVNRDATKVIEQIPEIKNKIREFWKKTLTHEVDSISPLRSDTDFFTSFNILQDWYWEDKFKTLYLDLYKSTDPTFNPNLFLKFKDAVDKKIAIIQYCPYSSCVSEINKKFHIDSMEYTRNLVYHLLDKETEERPLFVLLRSYDLWCEMLGEKTINKKSNFILRKKTTKGWPRGQFITENSFEDNGYSRIIEKLK